MKKSAMRAEKNEDIMKKKPGVQKKKNNSDVPKLNTEANVKFLEIRPSKEETSDEDTSTEDAGGTVPEAKCSIKTEYLKISRCLEAITRTNASVDARTRILKPIIDQLFEMTVDSTSEQKFWERLRAMTEVLEAFRSETEGPNAPAVAIDIESLSMIFEEQNLSSESAEIPTACPLKIIADKNGTLDSDINDSCLIAMAKSVERAAFQSAQNTSEVDPDSSINPKNTDGNVKIETFYEKDEESKVRAMLSWLIDDDSMVDKVIERKRLIYQHDFDISKLRDSLVDEAVDINLLAPYVEDVGFEALTKSLASKKKKNRFTCGTCGKRVVNDCVICDGCLLWHHFECADLKAAPPEKIWICLKCTNPVALSDL